MVATMINNAMGGRAEMKDFMLKAPEADTEGTIEDVFAILAGTQKV